MKIIDHKINSKVELEIHIDEDGIIQKIIHKGEELPTDIFSEEYLASIENEYA